jgi:glycogen debranching enzyme
MSSRALSGPCPGGALACLANGEYLRMGDADQTGLIDTIRRAYGIAVRDLRACYNPDGIVAGRLHFNAYWARDGFWALFGALALGDDAQALAQLNTFMRYQFPSGKLPVRVEFVGHHVTGYNTLRTRPKVVGRAGGMFSDQIDPTAFFIIAAREYLERTGDLSFCRRFDPVMDRAIRWVEWHDRDGDGIIESYFLADWMDSILKLNKLFNLNVIYYEGLRASAALKLVNGAAEAAAQFRQKADRVYDRLQIFWNGEYFSDWIWGARRGGFSADGNVLAMLFNIATDAQSRKILDYIHGHGLDATTPLQTCHPVYPPWQVFPMYYLAMIPDYHRTLIWPWLGTLNAVCKNRLGDRTGALADLSRIGEWYLRWNAVNEVYNPDGTPVARLFYRAEVPFAWAAGVYVYAVHSLGLEGALTV